MGKVPKRAVIFRIFVSALLLAACSSIQAEGQKVPTEGNVKYVGPMVQLYKDGSVRDCELSKEQEVTLQGEYQYKGVTYVKVSRHIDEPGTCDLTASKLLIEEQQLWGSQPLFPGQKK